MGVFQAIAGFIARRFAPSHAGSRSDSRSVGATYDAAQTNRHNKHHWGAADYLSPNAANTVQVRHALRSRSRYEAANNSLYAGVLRTIADHTVGTGPRIEFLGRNPKVNLDLADLWDEWSTASKFGRKLWIVKETQARDGECFGLTIGNPALTSRIQLDYQVLEADYVTSLRPVWTPWQVDGITYDPQWNPISYQVVTQRPNDVLPIVWPQQHEVDANRVWHYYRQERPGQGRGIPELVSAFELLAVLRRYIAASVSAAEVAASFAAFIKTQGPALTGQTDPNQSDSWLTLEIQRNLITMLPEGYDIQQLKPEQPTQSFTEFVKTLLTLLVRCVSMPLTIALCDSSGANYSSSRMDHQTYFRAVEIDRSWIQQMVLARVLSDFLAEAELVLGFARGALRHIKHEWHWPKAVSIDPQKDAGAIREKLESFQISITDAQKQSGVGGDIIRETAAYFGVDEATVRKDAYQKLYGAKPDAAPGAEKKPPIPDETPPTPAKPPRPIVKIAKKNTEARLACAAPKTELQCLAEHAQLELAAAEADGDPNAVPKFGMVGYTGGEMWLEGHDDMLVIDLASVEVASPKTPILYAHDDEREVGHADQVRVDAAGISVPAGQGFFSAANEWRDKVVNGSKRKCPWQASVGGRAATIEYVEPGETVSVNGRNFTGPIEIARGFRLREISILSLGADSLTSAELAARAAQLQGICAMNGYEEWVRAMGFDPASLTQAQAQALQNEWQSKQAAAQAEAAADSDEEKADDEEEHDDKDAEAADAESEEDSPEQQEARAVRDDERAVRAQARADRAQARELRATARANLAKGIIVAAPRRTAPPRPTTARARSSSRGCRTVRASAHNPRRIERDTRRLVASTTAAEMRRCSAIQRECGNNHDLACQAIEENWSLEKVQLTILRAEREKGVVRAGPVARPAGAPDFSAVVECSMLRRLNISASTLERLDNRYTPAVINAAEERDNRGYGLSRLVHDYLAAHGRHSRAGGLDDETIRAAIDQSDREIRAEGGGFSTISLSGILSNLLNKSLLQAFLAVPTASDKFCGAQDLNDFKVATRYRMSMAGTLVKVGPTGELQDATLGNEQWTNQLDTYGRTLTLNRQMMINDDLNAFTDLPRMMGRQAALSIEEAVFTLLLANPAVTGGLLSNGANPTVSDTNLFFSTQHNNYQSGANSALGLTGLTNAVTQFLKQTDAQGKPIVLNPVTLLVPPELLPLAEQLYKNQNLVSFNVSTSGSSKLVPAENPFINRYRPVMSPYLSNSILPGGSSTAWYLLADAADIPLIAIGYLKGQKTPTIDQGVPDANILGFRYRCYFDFGVGAVDWRAGVLNAGV